MSGLNHLVHLTQEVIVLQYLESSAKLDETTEAPSFPVDYYIRKLVWSDFPDQLWLIFLNFVSEKVVSSAIESCHLVIRSNRNTLMSWVSPWPP